jgi:hypothetical protein
MLDVFAAKEPFRIQLEQLTKLHILVMIVLDEFLVIDDTSKLWTVSHNDLCRTIDMITDPELRIVLLISLIIELCAFWQTRHLSQVALANECVQALLAPVVRLSLAMKSKHF